jgi:single-strand DNA-binding protein
MSGVNKVILMGNVGQEPKVRAFADGNSITEVSLATSDSWKDKTTGEEKTSTEWHSVVFKRRQAEIAAKYVQKGSKLFVEGRLKTRSWQKDGVAHYKTEVEVTSFEMLGGKQQASVSEDSETPF